MGKPKVRGPTQGPTQGLEGVRGGASHDDVEKERILSCSPLASLALPSRRVLFELGRFERLTRRQCVCQQGAPPRHLVLIGAGRVKVERIAEGRVVPLGHRGPGDLVGEGALAGATISSESATVLDEGDALVVPLAGLERQLASDAALRDALAAALVARKLETEARLGSLLLCTVEARLIEFLRAASRRWGQPHAAGQLVSAPFTHADIALLIGSTRETVTLLLGKWKRAGLIAFDRRRIVIRDGEHLAAHAATA
ncbi:Crp/Fnr family transcriptional regulator [Sorangium sp. So ce375]|uniref:Crp/Fnr family transcriptional regulator n=1 Tax=Sorangium sp. So ce375 TaxID=3133306 RepID=UPI003F5C193C